MQTDTSVIKLDINLIVPNKYQPRKHFDEIALTSLSESIKNYGILNPILVRKKEDKYEIIAGERRFRAAKQIGLNEVPVIIKSVDEQQMAELALIENLERQNLNAIEEAKSYEEIMKIGNQTQESLAQKLGKSQSTIANKIRLLSLPVEIQDALANQKISERHARSLISVKDKDKQLEILKRIIQEKLTVKETERIINEKEYTEEDIKQAINDIMKSLSMIDESENKEEKEDDNMNNGNFFPNFDNNSMNNNTSLNMMNEQSMNQQPSIAPMNEMVMPTMNQPTMEPNFNMNMQAPMSDSMMQQPVNNPLPDFNQFGQTPVVEPNFDMNMQAPMPDSMMQQPVNNPLPDFNQFNQAPTMEPSFDMNMQAPMSEPTMPVENNPLPSFGSFDVPPMNEMSSPMIDAPMPNSMMDTPLFNPDVVMPVENNGFEVPVTMPLNDMAQQEDKLTKLQNYLSSNGYTFKTLSNETENCIIIEIPKNY